MAPSSQKRREKKVKQICILLLCFFASFSHAKDARTKLLQTLLLTEIDKKQNVEAELAKEIEEKVSDANKKKEEVKKSGLFRNRNPRSTAC